MTETTIITTHIRSDSEDFDVRREFCGFQDKRLNDLRQFTSCIIDLQTQGKKDTFEKVTWIISHYDEGVRAFVVKRIQAWAQTTQISAQIHAEDLVFHQQNLLDSSSGSIDVKAQQLENSTKSFPSPPTNSVPIMFNKISKTPAHEHYYGSIPNAALVPQTDIQSRYQQRPRRNSSSSSSGIMARPALFGKPSDSFLSRGNDYPRSRYSPLSTPMSKSKFPSDNGHSLVKPLSSKMKQEFQTDININENKENDSDHDEEEDNTDFEEEAKWANLLSDTSDFESNTNPLMGDVFLVAQLRDCLVNCQISSNDIDAEYIQSLLPRSLFITGHEQIKSLNNKTIWFYRLTLNSKIILSNGIHKSRQKAQKLAYQKMLDLMTNKQGVEPRLISNGRCKVAPRKCFPIEKLNETTINDSTMNIY